jgi:hypothetical protein
MHTPLGGTWNEEIDTHIRTTKIVTQFPEVWPGSARSAALSFVVSLWLELGQRYRCWVSSCRFVWGSVWMMIHIIYLGTYVGHLSLMRQVTMQRAISRNGRGAECMCVHVVK